MIARKICPVISQPMASSHTQPLNAGGRMTVIENRLVAQECIGSRCALWCYVGEPEESTEGHCGLMAVVDAAITPFRDPQLEP